MALTPARFVFHLNKGAAQGREAPTHHFADLGGRGDGVAAEKAAARGQGAFHHGLVPLEQNRAARFC